MNLQELLHTPLCMLTGEQFLQLTQAAGISNDDCRTAEHKLVYGINELSHLIGCSPATIFNLKKRGILDDAIVSHVGRKIVFDADIALKISRSIMNKAI